MRVVSPAATGRQCKHEAHEKNNTKGVCDPYYFILIQTKPERKIDLISTARLPEICENQKKKETIAMPEIRNPQTQPARSFVCRNFISALFLRPFRFCCNLRLRLPRHMTPTYAALTSELTTYRSSVAIEMNAAPHHTYICIGIAAGWLQHPLSNELNSLPLSCSRPDSLRIHYERHTEKKKNTKKWKNKELFNWTCDENTQMLSRKAGEINLF